jgi:putative transcriptional regulator
LLDFNFENKLAPKQGTLLISEPFLESDYFTRSVILLCDHNEKGSFGFVLNNYLKNNFEGMPKDLQFSSNRVSIGGPVEVSNLYFIHVFGDEVPGSKELINGIYFGGDVEVLKEKLSKSIHPEKDVRYFLGYSGWDFGQLDAEIKEKSWVVCEPSNNDWIMDTSKPDLWEACLRSLGGKYQIFSNFPVNPNNN